MRECIVQIYEIQTPSEADAMIELGVDHIGSVLLSGASWRDRMIKETVFRVHSSTAKSSLIPLFSDVDTICRAMDYYRPDIVHFCENLTVRAGLEGLNGFMACQKQIRKRFPEIKMMRSIPVPAAPSTDDLSVFQTARMFAPISDYFLTDTLLANESAPEGDDQPVDGFVGITGITCDWEISARLTALTDVPIILAGGISPENVFDGIVKVRPAGVDSCTRTNAVDSVGNVIRFKKDIERVKQLIQEVGRAERMLSE